jgi:hypothetical protein
MRSEQNFKKVNIELIYLMKQKEFIKFKNLFIFTVLCSNFYQIIRTINISTSY